MDFAEPSVDVTAFVSPTVQQMILSGGYDWLSPVERSDRSNQRLQATAFVAIPSVWTQDSKIVEVVRTAEGALSVARSEGSVACPAGSVLSSCAAGVRCVVPCDGVVGDDPARDIEADPSCVLVANPSFTDESEFTCTTNSSGACGAGTVACSSGCFVPCDGSVGCVPNGKFGDELPELCGSPAQTSATAMAQPAFSETAFQASPTSPFVPGDRLGASSLFASTERSVFLVGGERDGNPTGEVWRYDLEQRAWHHELFDSVLPPQDVLATAYSPVQRRLYVLDATRKPVTGFGVDDVFSSGIKGGPHGKGPKFGKHGKHGHPHGHGPSGAEAIRVRLVVHDLSEGTSTLLGSWKRTGAFDRFALGTYDDGTVVLLLSGDKKHTTLAMRATSATPFKWTGIRVLPGRLAARPVLTLRGLVVPLSDKGNGGHLEAVEETAFAPSSSAPQSL